MNSHAPTILRARSNKVGPHLFFFLFPSTLDPSLLPHLYVTHVRAVESPSSLSCGPRSSSFSPRKGHFSRRRRRRRPSPSSSSLPLSSSIFTHLKNNFLNGPTYVIKWKPNNFVGYYKNLSTFYLKNKNHRKFLIL